MAVLSVARKSATFWDLGAMGFRLTAAAFLVGLRFCMKWLFIGLGVGHVLS